MGGSQFAHAGFLVTSVSEKSIHPIPYSATCCALFLLCRCIGLFSSILRWWKNVHFYSCCLHSNCSITEKSFFQSRHLLVFLPRWMKLNGSSEDTIWQVDWFFLEWLPFHKLHIWIQSNPNKYKISDNFIIK